jgi:propionyl-CoA carboxylase alpha chain
VLRGHAIEVRLYAEDATQGFLPSTGTLRAFDVSGDIRVDSGVESGSVVSPFYDPMLAKVIAYGDTRPEAASRLAGALARARLHGVTTNRDLLVRILREPEFLAGATDTGYLERHDPATLGAPLLDDAGRRAHAAAAVLALQAVTRARATALADLPSGWRNNASQPQAVDLDEAGEVRRLRYQIGRSGTVALSVDDIDMQVVLHSAQLHVVDATFDGVRRSYHVVIPPDETTIDVDSALGSSSYTVVPRFPDAMHQHAAGSLTAPMPGSVVRLHVSVGDAVTAGQPLLVLEAMKMEHTVAAPTDGVVTEVQVTAGQQVEAGATLVVLADPNEETKDAD